MVVGDRENGREKEVKQRPHDSDEMISDSGHGVNEINDEPSWKELLDSMVCAITT